MSDALTRLAAADPYARASYALDVDRVVDRVTRVAPREKTPWRRFQLRVSAAVGTSALVTLGAISAIQGVGSTLPVLNFAAAVTRSAFTTTEPFKSAVVATGSNVSTAYFRASPTLSSAPTQGAAYQLNAPAIPGGEAARLASIFEVRGPVRTKSNHTVWRVRDASATCTYFNLALPSWRYARFSSPTSVPGASFRSVRALETNARDLASRLGYGYQLGSPRVSFATSSVPTTRVNFPVVVGGVVTNLTLTFSYDARGVLVGASGPAFQVARTYLYPLVSARGGVARLNAAGQLTHPTSSTGAAGLVSSTHTLRRVTLSLEAVRLRSGALWLVPIYTYAGGPHARNPSWSVVALASRYVRHLTGFNPTPLAQR